MISVQFTALQYLSALTVLSPSDARKLSIDEEVYGKLTPPEVHKILADYMEREGGSVS